MPPRSHTTKKPARRRTSNPATQPALIPTPPRLVTLSRGTKETTIHLILNLDGTGLTDIRTGLGFFDHMLTALAYHARFDLTLHCQGDLYVDDHHSVEDCALALGQAIDRALGDRRGITRFAHAYAPLDEALARCVIDLSGRPAPVLSLKLRRDKVGEVSRENLLHFFHSLAMSLKASLHLDMLRGDNDHHKAEAAFKSLALALRQAVKIDASHATEPPSTKGTL